MSIPVLQSFLRARLLSVGADDSRLDKLSEVATELGEGLARNPAEAIPLALCAWDPSISNDPAFQPITELLEKHWPTYVGAFDGEPIVLYRALALEALRQAQETQPAIALALTHIGRNVLPLLAVGKDADALSLVTDASAQTFKESVANDWSVGSGQEVPTLGLLPQPDRAAKLDAKALQAKVEAAVGPTNRAGQPNSTPNPQWTNSPQAWSYDFSDRLTPILSEIHDKAVSSALASRSKVDAALNQTVHSFLETLADWFKARSGGVERQVNLLWWRQSLFSRSADEPYKSLAPELAALHMAIDLAAQIPAAYPAAVESFLREAVVDALGEERGRAEKHSMSSLFIKLGQPDHKSLITGLEDRGAEPAGRRLMAQAIANASSRPGSDAFRPSLALGIPDELTLTLGDFSVWALRELKALDAVANAEPIEDRGSVGETDDA